MCNEYPAPSDNRQVIKALKRGDLSAFERIYKTYSSALHSYALRVLQDSDAAHEVVQDTFVAVWTHRKTLDEGKPLRNYLLRAVHNNALRMKQREEARKTYEELAQQEIYTQWQDEPAYAQEAEWLIPAIERLPSQSRRVLQMSYWEEKKSAVIAQELSISVRTVETILYKVKKKLRGEYKKR